MAIDSEVAAAEVSALQVDFSLSGREARDFTT
jgi:hypothetical protein